jgi:polyhydroxybutyrate depolymerase
MSFAGFKCWLRAAFLGIDTPLTAAAAIVADCVERPEGTRHYLKALPSQAVRGKQPLVVLLPRR